MNNVRHSTDNELEHDQSAVDHNCENVVSSVPTALPLPQPTIIDQPSNLLTELTPDNRPSHHVTDAQSPTDEIIENHHSLQLTCDSSADDDGDSLGPSKTRFISDSEGDELESDHTYVYNFLQSQKVDDLKKIATLLNVPKRGESDLRKQKLVYCLFTRLDMSAKKKERTIRQHTKIVLRKAYDSFANKWSSLLQRKKVERIPSLETMIASYNDVMKVVTDERMRAHEKRMARRTAPVVENTSLLDNLDSDDSVQVANGDEEVELQRPAKRSRGRPRKTCEDKDDDPNFPKAFSVSEFGRIIVLIRDDEKAWEQWRVTLSGLGKNHASNKYTCSDFWPIFLEPLYNDPDYDLDRDFPGWIKCTDLNFNGRKRSVKELQKEFDTMKSLFSPIFVKYKTKTGVQDPSFRNFLRDTGYDMSSDFVQKLMIIGDVCEGWKEGTTGHDPHIWIIQTTG